jgi:hypothetical protein
VTTDAAKLLSDLSAEVVAEHVISECGGDARTVVAELVTIVRHLAKEIRALSTTFPTERTSPGSAAIRRLSQRALLRRSLPAGVASSRDDWI